MELPAACLAVDTLSHASVQCRRDMASGLDMIDTDSGAGVKRGVPAWVESGPGSTSSAGSYLWRSTMQWLTLQPMFVRHYAPDVRPEGTTGSSKGFS